MRMYTLYICFYEEQLSEKKNIQTNTQKKKNKKTKKQHVHQQKNLTTVLAKNKNVIELSLQLAGPSKGEFHIKIIQDNVRVWMGLTDN